MATETVLQNAYNLQEFINRFEDKNLLKDINNIIDYLQLEIVNKKEIPATEKSIYRSAKSYLKKQQSGNRKVLGYTKVMELNGKTYQFLTDSYTVFGLNKTISELPILDESKSDYRFPAVTRIFPNENNMLATKKINKKEFMDLLKTVDKSNEENYYIYIDYNENYSHKLDLRKLKDCFNILGNEIEISYYGEAKPAYLKSKYGIGLICPVRKY